ncbi:MAG: hypothetical protein GOP50_02435 [Candidatus Heimdallarchaeota archaeon]|nr:hypothetical protein [Candidatus Heimdallarchaeota archaeon]
MHKFRKFLSPLLLILIVLTLQSNNIETVSSEPMYGIKVLTIIHPEIIAAELFDVTNHLAGLGCHITYTGFVDSVILSSQTIYRDISVSEVNASDYDVFFMAGGWAGRRIVEGENSAEAITLIQNLFNAGVLMTSVCGGANLFVFADIINGTSLTAYDELAPEIEAAGGTYIDSTLVIDEPFVTVQGLFQHELVPAIAEVLGYYEEVPPSFVDLNVDYAGDLEYNVTVETDDDTLVQNVIIWIYKISDNQSTFFKGVTFKQTTDGFSFSGIISFTEHGIYSFDISITDWFGNSVMEPNAITINTVLDTEKSETRIISSILSLSCLGLIVFSMKNKKYK